MAQQYRGALAVLEAPALVAGLDDVAVVGKPIEERGLACCRFDGHQEKVFHATGGVSFRGVSLVESSRSKRFGL